MVYVLGALVGILAIVTIVLALQGKGRYSWVQFYARGKDAGFTMSEIGFLKRVAQDAGLEEPAALFWSVRQLDDCIKRVSQAAGPRPTEEQHGFLSRLYDYRKKIELDQPRYKNGIKSSRFIAEGQRMKVLAHGRGVFAAQVVENGPKHITVTYPAAVRQGSFQNMKVSAYFWRSEDAGYVFDTYVLEEMSSHGVPVLRLAHSDSLYRAQKRRSVRSKSRLPAYLYLLKRVEGAYEKPEKVPGLRCIVQDVSEDGAAVLIGGKARPGLKVKVQFFLGDNQIVMSGEVKGVEFSGDRKQSLMHVQAMPPSPRMRNLLLAYVFNLLEQEEAGGAADEEPEEVLEEPETLDEAEPLPELPGTSDAEGRPEGRPQGR